jgi:hypothetical protein
MANRKQNSKLTAWKAFMKRNLCKVEQMNDSDNVALLIIILAALCLQMVNCSIILTQYCSIFQIVGV